MENYAEKNKKNIIKQITGGFYYGDVNFIEETKNNR